MLFWVLAASAQQIGQNARPKEQWDFPNHGEHAVSRRDRGGQGQEGNPDRRLDCARISPSPKTACRRRFAFFEHQKLPEAPETAPPRPGAGQYQDLTTSLRRTRIAPEAPGNIRYKDRRLLALYFDMTAMPPADQMRALAAAEKFIRTQMTSADLVAILRYAGGAVDVLQDFTDDRNRLLSIIETMIVGEGQGLKNPPTTPAPPIPAPLSARTTASSTSSTPTGNCPRCRPPPKCLGSSTRRNR